MKVERVNIVLKVDTFKFAIGYLWSLWIVPFCPVYSFKFKCVNSTNMVFTCSTSMKSCVSSSMLKVSTVFTVHATLQKMNGCFNPVLVTSVSCLNALHHEVPLAV